MGEKIDERAVYAGLWKCRDFEIDHVWQRAVFLSAFLLACYAGYGGMILGLATAEHVRVPLAIVNLVGFCIAMIALLLSLVWIMMAKGSKAWYEHYEEAIDAFEKNHRGAFGGSCVARVKNADETISGFKRPKTSSWLWNTSGGAFSVAKINIVIGHISAVIWFGVILMHILIASKGFKTWGEIVRYVGRFDSARVMMGVMVFSLLLFWLYSLASIKSSFLKDCERKS